MRLLERMARSKISRRDFMKGSAMAMASVAGLSLAGCQENELTEAETTQSEPETNEIVAEHKIPEDVEPQGKWVAAACWNNCGGRCVNKALVVDGVVIRQKTDDMHEDSPEYPQQRACVRGRSQRMQCFGADRIKYPIKRKHWSLDDPHGELRGKDEWVRISWEEAMDLFADAVKQTVAKYGNTGILCGDLAAQNLINEVIKPIYSYGGCLDTWSTWSLGAFKMSMQHIGVGWSRNINDRFDLKNSDVLFVIGSNTAWGAGGSPMWRYKNQVNPNAKIIYVDPHYNETMSLMEAEWIPIRPATDTALLIGIAYSMLEKDAEKHLIDWDFLDRCTSGFDADHMPEGADPKENFKDYVLGTYDGVPKTPEWAEEITGVSADRIRQLAEELGKDNKVSILSGLAPARSSNMDTYPQMLMTLGAMGGHYGKSGHSCGNTATYVTYDGGPMLVNYGSYYNGMPYLMNPINSCIPAPQFAQAVLEGEFDDIGNMFMYHPAVKTKADIHMILNVGESCATLTRENVNATIRAYRAVDCVVATGFSMNPNCKYADIVLPIQTRWEWEGGSVPDTGNREAMFCYEQVTQPLYEAKDDQEIGKMLAERLGIDPATIWPFGRKQQFYNQLAYATYVNENGETVPICTVTQEDLDTLGVYGAPQQGAIGIRELMEKGVFQIKREEGDAYRYIHLEDFVKDPLANPLATSTGKLEIYCQTYADMINSFGFSTIPHIPAYIPAYEGYEESFANWETKEKGKYPYQMFTPHYLRRSHTIFDNIGWLREAWENPVFINASDAVKEGIMDGDTVLISNDRGKVLRHATVTERFMPGVIAIPHGSWLDMDEETGIDHGGAENVLGGVKISGASISSYNSILCKIEKYDGEELVKDKDRPVMMFED